MYFRFNDFKKLFFLILSCSLISSPAFSEAINSDIRSWSSRLIDDKLIQLSVNGQIVHGDILSIFLRKENCEFGRAQSYLYTIRSHEKIKKNLEDKFLYATFMGDKVRLRVSYVMPVDSKAHVAVIDMGVVKLDEIERILLSQGEITISYDALEGAKIEEYFDIRRNVWSTSKLSQSFKEAKLICQKMARN